MTRNKFLLMVCLGGSVTSACQKTTARETVLQESPLRIVTSSSPSIFPKEWLTAEIQARAKSLPPSELERTRRILNKALQKYPQPLLKKHLKTIYAVSALSYRGIGASGTNCEHELYIANEGADEGYDDLFIEGTFHHEFSSTLLWYHPKDLDTAAWKANNPRGFRYGEDGVEAVKAHHDNTESDLELCAKGFLCEYSQASLEDDFNMLAERLFTQGVALRAIAARFPKIQAKRDLVIAFYQKQDPTLNAAFFASLAEEPTPKSPFY